MLSRRATHVAVRPELAGDALRPLPLPLVLAVVGCLPADDKLRLAFVSPAFRAVADEMILYEDVKLGVGSGVARVCDALLRAVSAKAMGTMRTLDVSGRTGIYRPAVTLNAVVAVCEANAATLEAVDARCEDDDPSCMYPRHYHLRHAGVARLLAAVPRLRRLDADVECTLAQLQALVLQHTGVLRVRRLLVLRLSDAAAVVALVAAVEALALVSQLELREAPLHTAASLDAVVSLSLARRLGALTLRMCRLGAASMPALTRLLGRECGLVSLENFDAGAIALPLSPGFCAALRASTLQRLVLSDVRLFDNTDAGIALLAAATGHPSLQLLSITRNFVPYGAHGHCHVHHAAVGAALGALVAFNAPSLTSLDVCDCNLWLAGMAPLVAALAGNTALRFLAIKWNNAKSPELGLLAAVRANTGLRQLEATESAKATGFAKAQALVAARA